MTHDPNSPSGVPFAAALDCEKVMAEVDSFLDQDLTDAMRASIAAHLESCSPCFEVFDFEAELRIVISTKTHTVEFPDTLRIRIEEKLTYLRIEGSGGTESGGGGEPRPEA